MNNQLILILLIFIIIYLFIKNSNACSNFHRNEREEFDVGAKLKNWQLGALAGAGLVAAGYKTADVLNRSKSKRLHTSTDNATAFNSKSLVRRTDEDQDFINFKIQVDYSNISYMEPTTSEFIKKVSFKLKKKHDIRTFKQMLMSKLVYNKSISDEIRSSYFKNIHKMKIYYKILDEDNFNSITNNYMFNNVQTPLNTKENLILPNIFREDNIYLAIRLNS
mgnify:CR=1 FL=1